MHIVTPDGKIPNAILPPEGDGGGTMMSMPRGVDGAGRLFYQGSMRPGPGGVASVDSAPILRWDRLAKRVDTLGKVATGMSMTTSGSQGNMNVSIRSKPWLKAGSSVIGFGAGVVYVARRDPEDDMIYLEKYAR